MLMQAPCLSSLYQLYFFLPKWGLPVACLITSLPWSLRFSRKYNKEKSPINPEVLLSQLKISKLLDNMTLQTV